MPRNMEPAALSTHLATHLVENSLGKSRILVAIAGPPGSGKSTLAELTCAELHSLGQYGAVVPMDGFHLDNSILMERGLLSRKGAPQTFDAAGFVHLVQRLKHADADVVIPVFDRDRDIAVAGARCVRSQNKFLLIEGNYLLSKDAPWNELVALWDVSVFLKPSMDILQKRLIQRWLDMGVDRQSAQTRVLHNDIPNAEFVLGHSTDANLVFP